MDIKTGKDVYTYNEEDQKIYKNGSTVPDPNLEPIYSENSEGGVPEFAGIYFRDRGQILSVSGNFNNIDDINSI